MYTSIYIYVCVCVCVCVCMVITVGCSVLLIISCLIGKSSTGKLHKLCIAFQYIIVIRMLDCEIKTEIVVGWFEEELWVVRGPCGTVLVTREPGLWIGRNRVDCEAMCGSLYCWMKVSHIRSWGEWTTPYKGGETSTQQGAFWGQNREGCTGLRVSVPWCELCSPKADNTSSRVVAGCYTWFVLLWRNFSLKGPCLAILVKQDWLCFLKCHILRLQLSLDLSLVTMSSIKSFQSSCARESRRCCLHL